MSTQISDEIELVIENQSMKCSRSILINNSDFFKVMLEGNFKEKNASTINLPGIDFGTLKPLLTLLGNDGYILDIEKSLAVLETSCLLQFEQIRDKIITHLIEFLNPVNCVKIWLVAELLDLSPLHLKAKTLALIEFNLIKELEFLVELEIGQLHSYLANEYLNCKSEMDVFKVCMRWLSEKDKNQSTEGDNHQIIISLFSCIDFTKLSNSDINEMMLFPIIAGQKFIIDVLNCLVVKKNNGVISEYSETVLKDVEKLLGGNLRKSDDNWDVLLFAKTLSQLKNVKCDDDIKTKRSFVELDDETDVSNSRFENVVASILYLDNRPTFHKYIDISREKINESEGFQMVGYKEQIFLFGGEYILGSGSWNLNLWVFDSIRERWEIKSKLPYGRRHFESCICSDNLYIIGGTGSYRVVQDNMFFYKHKENIWSNLIKLPVNSRFLKCCNYKNQLFLLNLTNLCGYLFEENNSRFIELKIINKDNVFTGDLKLFSLFSYNNRIIIKGTSIIEMEVIETNICIVSHKNLKEMHCDFVESVVCRDKVYSLYKNIFNQRIKLEIFCLKTYTSEILFESCLRDAQGMINKHKYNFSFAKLFTMQHYSKLHQSAFINNL